MSHKLLVRYLPTTEFRAPAESFVHLGVELGNGRWRWAWLPLELEAWLPDSIETEDGEPTWPGLADWQTKPEWIALSATLAPAAFEALRWALEREDIATWRHAGSAVLLGEPPSFFRQDRGKIEAVTIERERLEQIARLMEEKAGALRDALLGKEEET